MLYTTILAASYIAAVSAHGVVTGITGANGVSMSGLSVIAGTPRDCASPGCGSEADTSIIRTRELGGSRASALGRNSAGPIDAAAAVSAFMGAAAAKRGLLSDLLGGGAGKAAGGAGAVGVKSTKGATQPSDAGAGASSGLPTCSDSGVVAMTYHQVNQDGAGPLTAMVDPTSGGTDAAAFVPAKMIADVPGKILGLSGTTTTDFAISAQMPAGMVCSGTVAGQAGVCVMRLNNGALAGPFGGSVAFIQSAGAAKRAFEYNLSKRHFARGMKFARQEEIEEECAEEEEE